MTLFAASSRTGGEDSWAGTRIGIAILLVLLYAGASSVRWVQRASEWPAGAAQDEISSYEHAFGELRGMLPAHGIVGYAERPGQAGAAPADSTSNALQRFRRYLLAQYFLAPVLLVKNREPEFVVGNFGPGAVPAVPAGLRLIRDFGDGLVLFRRSGS
jgi:hypothetical protein